MIRLVSIFLFLFGFVSLGICENYTVATGRIGNLTNIFRENVETGKLNKNDPKVVEMEKCLEKSREIKVSSFADRTSIVTLDVIPVEKMGTITDHLYGGKLRKEGRYRYLSAVWEENKDLFNESNNGTWPYTVGGENYVKHLSENYENRDFLMEKKGLSPYEAAKYLNKKILDSSSANPAIRNDAERELDEFPHSAKSFGKLVKSIKRNRYDVTRPVILDGEGGTRDGSHRLFATQFLADKSLFRKNSCFISFVKPSKEDVENGDDLYL
ncbi:MAG: hypothetical protein LBB44_00135 [Endomicrobium sp.]|jgi:hypothetical protein|nr:hypothetical protein [Endomicrobium sp.]